MPVVNANENPILLEEVLDEGLIDALRQGANYLKDRRTIRRFNRLNNNIANSSNPSELTNSENYKAQKRNAELADSRAYSFKNYIKSRYGKQGRAEAKANRQLGNDVKLSGKEKEIMRLQDKVAQKQNNPNFSENDPDLKRLQKLTGDMSKENPDTLKSTLKNVRDYRKQNAPAVSKDNNGNYIFNRRKLYIDPNNSNSYVANPYEKGNNIIVGPTNRPSQIKPVPNVNTATNNKNLNQQAKNQFNQASKAAYGNKRPVTAPAR